MIFEFLKGVMMVVNRKWFLVLAILLVFINFASGDTNWQIQSVNSNGAGNHPDLSTSNKVTVEGIILNNPSFMLNGEPNENSSGLGGQWQIYIQGDGNDHAGTAIWMGQVYDNAWGGDGTYTNEQWLSEIYALNHDPTTGYEFSAGDKVRVTGLLKYYNGKTNINERHSTEEDNNITIELVEPAVGLPKPWVITLSDVKDANDNKIFDATRLSGGEYYQGQLVRINDVSFVERNWGADNTAVITDGTGRTLPVKYGTGYGFSKSCNLAETFDVIGIFDQEGVYRLWVCNYDGNGLVLTDRGSKYNLVGEVTGDGKVDFTDMAELAENWLKCIPGSDGCSN
ncbi:MAG TPA: hypothetical protein PLP05_00150 [Sedimentisphaerales bacterium]|nr:hypothetical protein [Sedimentisphaerales bacterium]